MSKKERVLAALNRQDVDRTPVANQTSVATVEMMDLVDAPFPEACRSAELNAKLAATEISQFDFDSIAPYFSIKATASLRDILLRFPVKTKDLPDISDA